MDSLRTPIPSCSDVVSNSDARFTVHSRDFDCPPLPGLTLLPRRKKSMPSYLTRGAHSLSRVFAGHVSKTTMLTTLLPLSLACFFGSLITAALSFATGYDWRVRVISALTSPRHNPEGFWLPAIGIIIAMLLALPLAGYLTQRLNAVNPQLARSAGLAFATGFLMLILSVAVQFAEPFLGVWKLHTYIARVSAGSAIFAMLCCSACALKDRFRRFGGRRALPTALVLHWLSLTLVPVGCLLFFVTLLLLGNQAGQVWAEDFRQSFRHTMFWKLAFWEWVGIVITFTFLAGSVMFLPDAYERTAEPIAKDSDSFPQSSEQRLPTPPSAL
jgi:hypothetical protein